ncbi:MAG: hypothetical protein KDB22_02950 [Planctomycetales bacterium]|nr:hypothetical protein [Planctomycetales bacterium]
MNDFTQHSHISRILTNPRVLDNPQAFFDLYALPIRKFFLCLCGNADEADEQCQEFAVKFLTGSFDRFDASKGRFRDYLKSSLRNQVRKSAKFSAKLPGAIPENHDALDPKALQPIDSAMREFDSMEGKQIMQLVDEDMHADEQDGKNRYHSLLAFVLQYQQDRLEEFRQNGGRAKVAVSAIVDFFEQRFGERISTENAKQRLRRAKATFASKMISEIAVRLRQPTRETIREAAEEMNLWTYIHKEMT